MTPTKHNFVLIPCFDDQSNGGNDDSNELLLILDTGRSNAAVFTSTSATTITAEMLG